MKALRKEMHRKDEIEYICLISSKSSTRKEEQKINEKEEERGFWLARHKLTR
jgi:hypothetical protein